MPKTPFNCPALVDGRGKNTPRQKRQVDRRKVWRPLSYGQATRTPKWLFVQSFVAAAD
jgi:hypothetical protein